MPTTPFDLKSLADPSDADPGDVLALDEQLKPGWTPPSGGGSTPVNYATISLGVPADPILTPDNFEIVFQEDDLSIASQSGTDFSVGTYHPEIGGAIFSASGGLFQVGLYCTLPTGDLDVGSSADRFVLFAIQTGDDDDDPNLAALGFDYTSKVYPTGSAAALCADTHASLPGLVRPGGPVAWNISFKLRGGFGTDAVDISDWIGWPMLAVWQIA